MDKPSPPGFHPELQPPPDRIQPHPIQQQPGPPILITAPVFGPQSTTVHCRTCNATVNTNIVKQSSGKTHLIAIGLCIFGCWPCVPCVYCVDSFRVINHHCPNCNNYLGVYSRL